MAAHLEGQPDIPDIHALKQGADAILQARLQTLNLGDLTGSILPELVRKEHTAYDEVLTLGFPGLDESNIALLTAFGQNAKKRNENDTQMPVRVLLPIGTDKVHGLQQDEDGNLTTALFYEYDGDTFTLVQTDQRVLLDGIIANYALGVMREMPEALGVFSSKELDLLARDKYATKIALADYVPIPSGSVVDTGESDAEVLQELQTAVHTPQIVVKPRIGTSQGTGVQMFETENTDGVLAYMQALRQSGLEPMLEERIVPDYFWHSMSPEFSIKGKDWNVRSIIMLTDEGPVMLGYEYRFDEPTNKPVNVSQGAAASTGMMEAASTRVLLSRMITTVSMATGEALIAQGNSQNSMYRGLVGLDIIYGYNFDPTIGDNPIPFVDEINTGAIGGFGTLTKLDRRRVEVAAGFIENGIRSFLEENHTNRRRSA